jgi:hypothetical protein
MSKSTGKRGLATAVSTFLATFESEVVPQGWHTVRQLEPHLGVRDRQAANIAQRFVKHKQAEVRTFRILVGSMIRPVPHYRFTPAAEKALGLTKRRA